MAKKDVTYYRVPDKYWYRIHFVRPRFKSNMENVLLYMANECCHIEKCSCDEYNKKYLDAIRMFPGNIAMSKKTLQNWRTEIPALFGFYQEDKEQGVTETSKMAKFLNENQDLTQFLRLFLYSFQFPGGHIKPQELKSIIFHGIKFKPVRSIIQVLMAGNELLSADGSSKEMSISAEEATYCIFNDIRVTSNSISPTEVAKIILSNRKNKLKYYNPKDSQTLSLRGEARNKGDMTRYAGDILDYMEIANLLEKHYNYFSLKGNESVALKIFVEDTSWFDGYDSFYGKKDIETSELTKVEHAWFNYVNDSMKPDLFKTDIRTILSQKQEIDIVIDDRIKSIIESSDTTTKSIGNLGEALIYGHEKMRIKLNGYDEFVKLIQIVDSPSYHPGYDIDSFEADGTEDHRYIEVKTTISKHQLQIYNFHMSTNEWRVAGTIKEHYFVYRLMVSEKNKTLFILKDPVALYKGNTINMIPRDGADISFSTEHFKPSELLIWQEQE